MAAGAATATAASLPPTSTLPDTESVNQVKDTDSFKQPEASASPPPTDSPSSADAETIIDSSEGVSTAEEDEEQGEEEKEECGFCLFMKGGGCREEFIAWENCVEEAEKTGENVVDKCMEVTSLLKKCMDAHADYYDPILKAEREMADAISEGDIDKETDSEIPK
ncbi:hypothetical protein AXF42_Ash005048 [Apostasia shenzhenica]|uniref:GCK domain-containing protein n=1 Tax=Apostasia shenzhenica TaxID=1088818 RepID=A0A2I0B8B5_9ASPA|nr:hypothetical protein AXF42_Ash005048 [Apostasia shenzhenica]